MTTYHPGSNLQNQAGEKGALGCSARTVAGNPAGADVTVFLGSAHVMFGSVANQTDVAITETTKSGTTCSKDVRVARTLYSWDDGFRQVKIRVTFPNGTTQTHTGAETDCAIARLEPGVHFSNEIPGIGAIKGTPTAGALGVVEGPPFGTLPETQHYVRYFSPVDQRVHYGTLIKPSPTTATYLEGGSGAVNPLVWPVSITDEDDKGSDIKTSINQILILPRPEPNPNPAPGQTPQQILKKSYEPYLSGRKELSFCQHGDSGSVVVNSANQVIGVIVRTAPKELLPPNTADEWRAMTSFGIVCPIGKVLDQMKIMIPETPFSGALPQAGPIDLASPGALDHPETRAMHEEMARLRTRVSEIRLGRVLLGMINRHDREVRRIVNGRRPALAAWRHNEGPAFFAHLLRGLRDPSHQIPTSINGVTRTQALEAMAAMLVQYGGDQLRRDVERYRDLLLRHAPTIVRLDDVPEAIAQVSWDHLRSAEPVEEAR